MWVSLHDAAKAEPVTVESVGFLLRDDKKTLTLAACLGAFEQASNITSIPADWVIKKTKIG